MAGRYIVIEGQDGIGKTTQVELLKKYYKKQGKEVITTREPGGDLPATVIIRKLLKERAHNLDGMTNALLFAANRRELWLKIIEPALSRDAVVISDRNWWSTLAFECFGMDVSEKFIKQLHAEVMPERYIRPDVGIIMHLDEKLRAERIMQRDNNQEQDSFESRKSDFQKRVSNGYLKIAKEFGVPIVDATPSPEKIHEAIVELVN